MVKGISFIIASLVVAVASVHGAPQPVATQTADMAEAAQPGVELYQGLHLPPALRSRRRGMHKRDVPYGGFLTFGNYPAQTSAPAAAQRPCNEKSGESRHKPLLGLIDVDLDLHL
ncbi:hypothetical protein IWW38_000734 [Coemansia aciculifera]|uniref:Uncharacterized protein n=1 Tax=Coemansia aciculifera TaxID=417176 RepID=A0ACC1M8W5_9FUNG|nr:hypothetical protein IWW38_000734 [Coemansia aciculifera]